MKQFIFNGKEYSSIYSLVYENPQFVIPNNCPENLLNDLGITVKDVPDPEIKQTPEDNLRQAKNIRAQEVNEIKVIVDGMEFDGNEQAQIRMSNAIAAASIGGDTSVQWVLANNTIKTVTIAQLKEAFTLANNRMQELWLAPYEN